MAWYIIEGPDQVGKTTLALGLQKRGWHYAKATESDTLPELATRMAGLLRQRHVVWDRAHLSEVVHHNDRIDREWFSLIETMLHSVGARCVLLTQRLGDEAGYENDLQEHTRLAHLFQQASAWSWLTWSDKWPDPMPRVRVDEAVLGWD